MKRHRIPSKEQPPSVLLVAPETNERFALQAILQSAECRTFICGRCRDAFDLIQFASVVICGDSLPDGSWQDVLRTLQALGRSPALIVTSRLADDRLWAEVLNLGGYDVLAQPLRAQEVMWAVRSAHRQWRTVAESEASQCRALPEKVLERRRTAERKPAAVCLFGHSRGGVA